jgi:hypothetical protein
MARGAISLDTDKVLADAVKVRDRVAKRLAKAREAVVNLADLEETHERNESVVNALGGKRYDFGTDTEDPAEFGNLND